MSLGTSLGLVLTYDRAVRRVHDGNGTRLSLADTPGPYPPTMSTSEATRLARIVVAGLGHADDHAKRLGAVILLLADEVDRLAGVVDRLTRQAR